MNKNDLAILMIIRSWLVAVCLIFSGLVQANEFSRCVTDMSGRQVCLKTSHPNIISLSPGSTELLFAAGAGGQMIAVDEHSDYPSVVEQLPSIGGFPVINVEAIVGMKPDLVVVWVGGDSPKVVKQLESLGVNTFHLNAVDFSGIEQAILSLGKILGTEKQAEQSVSTFRARLSSLEKTFSQLEPVTVFYEVWRSPLMTVGDGILINDVISLCGGNNVYGDQDQKIPKIGIESLIIRNPQAIIGSAPQGDTPETRREMKRFWGQWENLQAVRTGQLFSVPSDLISRTSPRILDGAEILCRQLQEVRSRQPAAVNNKKAN
ncbi:cobalamin-binding protein [Endozoicomonas ascidiicola]|uniref:cobalamin-binding protein n=1 Tax=Endozoicomonas ascidiicola TaxID=1698521 RepID=UPI000B09CD7E|nr:cobalamin-binding protein [Endozoicomonas ascidiicola]